MTSFLARISFLAAALAFGLCAPAQADKQEGYYYPAVTSEEEFTRKMIDAPPADASVRETFVALVLRAQLETTVRPRFSLFAKGEGSRRLIMVGLEDEAFRTLYRARAVLAQITYDLRSAPFFLDQGIEVEGTFFDLLQALDFESLTVSDGTSWAHRVYFK